MTLLSCHAASAAGKQTPPPDRKHSCPTLSFSPAQPDSTDSVGSERMEVGRRLGGYHEDLWVTLPDLNVVFLSLSLFTI